MPAAFATGFRDVDVDEVAWTFLLNGILLGSLILVRSVAVISHTSILPGAISRLSRHACEPTTFSNESFVCLALSDTAIECYFRANPLPASSDERAADYCDLGSFLRSFTQQPRFASEKTYRGEFGSVILKTMWANALLRKWILFI